MTLVGFLLVLETALVGHRPAKQIEKIAVAIVGEKALQIFVRAIHFLAPSSVVSITII